MNRCIIFTGGELKDYQLISKKIFEKAYIIAADSGYNHAINLDVQPDLVVGDYDSLGFVPDKSKEVLTFPKEKDDSDLMLAVREALKRGYKEIIIIGALGGRFDHTIANLQTLGFISNHGAVGKIVSATEEITLLEAGEYKVKKDETRSLSLLAYSEKVEGVTLKGVKYPLEKALITNSFPIGLSNVIVDDYAEISFEKGQLLMICSKL